MMYAGLQHVDSELCKQKPLANRWEPSVLDGLGRVLAGIETATEQSFIELGNRIQNFHGRAGNISASVGEVFELLDGEDGEQALQRLPLLIEKCDMWLKATDKKSSELSTLLQKILNQINDFALPVKGLKKVIKTLHPLRVSTRIEAARGYASGTVVLAKALDELGVLVRDKVFEIFALTESLIPVINRSISMENAAQSGSIRVASSEADKARRTLAGLLDAFLETEHWTGRLQDSSNGVALSFGEMVSALQFQDITRQRLEHVRKALHNLGLHLKKFNQRQDFNNDAEAERLFGGICRLQYDQLNLASREFVDAADNLAINLDHMSSNVVAMASDTRSLLQVSDDTSGNRYAIVLSTLRSIALHLEKSWTIHQSTAINLAEVNEGVQKVSLLVEEIEFVSEEMQLLAINAAISAAHAQRQGAGLDVIATNIQNVAEEACHYALALAQQCAAITEHARSLQIIEEDNQSVLDEVRDLIEQARESMKNLDACYTRLVKLAEKVDRDACDLAEDVTRIISSLNIGEQFREKLSPVLKRFAELGLSSDEGLTGTGNTSLETLFNELELCYTMASERQIHQSLVSSQGQSTGELSQAEDEWAACRHHDLGDNIDLF